MKKLSVLTYLKILVFIVLAVVAIKFPNNDFDRVIADLLEIKALAQIAKIISLVFNDKLLLLIMILLTGFLVWIKELKKAVFIFFSAGFRYGCSLRYKRYSGKNKYTTSCRHSF